MRSCKPIISHDQVARDGRVRGATPQARNPGTRNEGLATPGCTGPGQIHPKASARSVQSVVEAGGPLTAA